MKWRLTVAAQTVENVYISFGSNLGNREYYFSESCNILRDKGYKILRQSSLYETEPWGMKAEVNFLNAVLEIEPRENPRDFLQELQQIEISLDRTHEKRYASRTCDLDILLWGNSLIDKPYMKVPHPLMPQRKFILVPLCDLIPNVLHPLFDKTFAELLAVCTDTLKVWKFSSQQQ